MRDIVVIKVGTSTLAQKGAGGELLDTAAFERIGQQILRLRDDGYGVVIVSSAAITAGMVVTGSDVRPDKTSKMPELQRLASIGWRYVLNAWDEALPGVTVGELLVTKRDLTRDDERQEVLNVTRTLLHHDNVVVVNENDALTHEEIAFGDNDTLAATFAARLHTADLFGGDVKLVILTDVEGVYQDRNDPTTLVPIIRDISTISNSIGGVVTTHGTGGMTTKIEAARIAGESGVETWLAHGRHDNAIHKALAGTIGTYFHLS